MVFFNAFVVKKYASIKLMVGAHWTHTEKWGICGNIYIYWLVVSTPLKNMSSSVGMIIPNTWKNNPNVPNHQPDIYIYNIPLNNPSYAWLY